MPRVRCARRVLPTISSLVADRETIAADGRDLAFVTVKVVDKDGNLCPDAQHRDTLLGKG